MTAISFSLDDRVYPVRATLPLLMTIEDELGALPLLKAGFEDGRQNREDVVSIIHMMVADTGEVVDYLKLKDKIQAEGYEKFARVIRSFFKAAQIPSEIPGKTRKIRS